MGASYPGEATESMLTVLSGKDCCLDREFVEWSPVDIMKLLLSFDVKDVRSDPDLSKD